MARRPSNPLDAAEALFKPRAPAAPASAPLAPAKAVPGVKELVSLKIDQDVLHHFQAEGPGWQERINRTLRAASGLHEGSDDD